jgi:RNA polymerase sigma factor (sigma-70 family)
MESLLQTAFLIDFVQGDLGAFEALFRDSQHEVYRWIAGIVRNPSVAEELTIETFWRVYKSRAHFDPTRSFQAWLRRIATNVALSYLKSAPAVHDELTEVAGPPTQDSAVQRDTREQIQKAFHALPVKLRVPVLPALVEDIPQREIAGALGISEAAVKARTFRATHLLRKRLTQMGITP